MQIKEDDKSEYSSVVLDFSAEELEMIYDVAQEKYLEEMTET